MIRDDRICVIIPTYDNAGTILSVVEGALQYVRKVFVVCDGPTDGTSGKVQSFASSCGEGRVSVIRYSPNRGKGVALMAGFRAAAGEGFEYALTMDSDGQHPASAIPAFIKALHGHSGSLVVGSRGTDYDFMPDGNKFANRFSNFWFALQTLHFLPDTQSGFRLYPLGEVSGMHLFTSRYETELEILVRCAWRGIPLIPLQVRVLYPPAGERISHFRKGKDFLRISLLNTVLTCLAPVYGYPSMLIRKLSCYAKTHR